MSSATVSTIGPRVNPEERKLIGRIRRIAKRHNLRLAKSRRYGYKLQSATDVANYITLERALAICKVLDGGQ